LHAIYIVPMAASLLPPLRAYLIELVVFAACAAQYWTLEHVRAFAGDERFFWQSIILLCATALILALLATHKPRARVSS
jgi:hypothetical protein